MRRHGTHQAGANHGSARLTEDQVQEIRRKKQKEKRRVLAAQHGVSMATVSDIWTRRTWRHV
jgi:hypothetical protein